MKINVNELKCFKWHISQDNYFHVINIYQYMDHYSLIKISLKKIFHSHLTTLKYSLWTGSHLTLLNPIGICRILNYLQPSVTVSLEASLKLRKQCYIYKCIYTCIYFFIDVFYVIYMYINIIIYVFLETSTILL